MTCIAERVDVQPASALTAIHINRAHHQRPPTGVPARSPSLAHQASRKVELRLFNQHGSSVIGTENRSFRQFLFVRKQRKLRRNRWNGLHIRIVLDNQNQHESWILRHRAHKRADLLSVSRGKSSRRNPVYRHNRYSPPRPSRLNSKLSSEKYG